MWYSNLILGVLLMIGGGAPAWAELADNSPLEDLSSPEVLEDYEPYYVERAPFGLDWNMPLEELGVEKSCQGESSFHTICKVKRLPENLPEVDYYELHFFESFGLQAIKYFSPTLKNDSSGKIGKRKFENLLAALAVRYPMSPVQRHVFYNKTLAAGVPFYHCLHNSQCGQYEATLRHVDGSHILVKLNGDVLGNGFISLNYYSPEWTELQRYLQKIQDIKDLYNIDPTIL